jgi:hypothetical protein
MAINKICQVGLLCLCLLNISSTYAEESPFGQTFQITTRLNSYVGKPSWLIIVRDVNTGQVLPYLYDITTTDNFWLGFTFSHAYQVITSELEFGPPNAAIHNYCHLEDGVLDRESFTVTVTGDLTPNRLTSHCHVFKYKQFNFPIVEKTASTPEPITTTTTTTTTNEQINATPAPNISNAITKSINTAVDSGLATGISNVVGNILAGGTTK